MPIVTIDHGQTGTHISGEIECRDAGTEREGREGVPEIVDPPQRLDARRSLGGSPLERAEVVDVEVAASLTGKQKRRAVAGHDPVQRIESASLQWHGSRARLRLRDLQLAARERTANERDTLL